MAPFSGKKKLVMQVIAPKKSIPLILLSWHSIYLTSNEVYLYQRSMHLSNLIGESSFCCRWYLTQIFTAGKVYRKENSEYPARNGTSISHYLALKFRHNCGGKKVGKVMTVSQWWMMSCIWKWIGEGRWRVKGWRESRWQGWREKTEGERWRNNILI